MYAQILCIEWLGWSSYKLMILSARIHTHQWHTHKTKTTATTEQKRKAKKNSCGRYLKETLFPPISVAVSLDKEFTGRRAAGSYQVAFSVNGSVVWILFLGHFKRVGSSSLIATSCQRQRKARKKVQIFTDNLSRFIWWGTNWEAQVSCFSMLKKGFMQIMSLT